MPKVHYFSNKFSKIAKPGLLIFDFGGLKLYVIWPNSVFSSWLWWIRTSKYQLWRHFSDVIAIMSPKNDAKISSQIFFHFDPSPIKIFGSF